MATDLIARAMALKGGTGSSEITSIKTDISNLQADKVDKAEGKSLISDTEITRLSTLDNYDDTAVKADIQAIQGLIPSSASTSNQLADKAYVSAMQSGSPYVYMTQAEYEALTEYEPDRLYWVVYPLSGQYLIWKNGECYTNEGIIVGSNSNPYVAIAYNPANNNGASFFSNLKKIDIAKGVTTINDYAFYKCTNLTAVSIPEGVTSIGDNAFKECTALTSISISDGVTSIDSYAFCGCSSLTAVSIPEGVTSIGMSTFSFCTSLKSVSIPSTVTDIYYDAYSSQYNPSFGGCTQSGLTITINKPSGSIKGSPWGAKNATIIWAG